MKLEELMERAGNILERELPKAFRFKWGDIVNETGDNPSVLVEVIFEFGNRKNTHILNVEWDEFEGIVLAFGENPDYMPITKAVIMETLYYDLALKNLDEEYLL